MINLLPPEVKESVKFAKLNVILLQYVGVIILTSGIIAGLMLFGKSSLEQSKDSAQERITISPEQDAEIKQVAQDAINLSKTIKVVGGIFESEVQYSIILKEIGSVIPQGVELTSLSLSEDSTQPVRISANLTTAELAGVLQANIIASDIFLSADILEVSTGSGSTIFTASLEAYFDPKVPLSSIDEATQNVEAAPPETAAPLPASSATETPAAAPELTEPNGQTTDQAQDGAL